MTARPRGAGGRAKTVVVFGSTGRQGRAVSGALLARGWRVRGLTRDAGSARAAELARAGAEMVPAPGTAASLEAAMRGAHGVFLMQPSGIDSGEELRAVRAAAGAASAAGVRHLVYSSSAGAARSGSGVANYEVKWRAARALAEAGLPHTLLRPVTFMENYLLRRSRIEAGVLEGPFAPGMRQQLVAVRDIGAVSAELFARPGESRGSALDLAGEELSLEAVAGVFARALGRPVRYAQRADDTVGDRDPEQMRALLRWREREGHRVDVAALRARMDGWGVSLTTLAEWIRLCWPNPAGRAG